MNFNNSSIKITGMLNTSIAFHYVYSIGHTILQGLACCNTFVGTPKGVMANMFAKNGIYIISKCNSIDEAIANNNHTFDEGRVMSNDWFSLNALSAFNIYTTTSIDNEIDLA